MPQTLGRQLLQSMRDIDDLLEKTKDPAKRKKLNSQYDKLHVQMADLIEASLNPADARYVAATNALSAASDTIEAALDDMKQVAQAIKAIAEAINLVTE